MIDPATGWFEIHQYDDKRAITVANIAEEEWFSRYPWPTQVTYDRGTEFIGQEFQKMLDDYGIIRKNLSLLEIHKQMPLWKECIKLLATLSELLNFRITTWMKMILGRASSVQQRLQFVQHTTQHFKNLQANLSLVEI